jgi:hypothetical protein
VGEVAKAVAHCKTPHADKVHPSAALIVTLKGLTKGDTEKVRKALADVKGVVAKESSAGEGQAVVALDHKGGAQLSQVANALKGLGK